MYSASGIALATRTSPAFAAAEVTAKSLSEVAAVELTVMEETGVGSSLFPESMNGVNPENAARKREPGEEKVSPVRRSLIAAKDDSWFCITAFLSESICYIM